MEHQNPTKTQCLNSDIISTLPQNIIENNILSRMTLRDAVRTSILSKEWRYTWRSMPKLVFTRKMVKRPSNRCCTLLHKYKLVNAIFNVLLLHNGPTILEFESLFGKFCIDSEFAQIISYLAKGNKVKELSFDNVEVSAQMFRQFLSKCSLLEDIVLIACEKTQKGVDFVAGENKFTFVDLLQCVPLIVLLQISKYYMKYLSAGGMPRKLPTSLAHLEYLYLDLCMAEKDEISSALCMIMSSPLLKKIHFVSKMPFSSLRIEQFCDLRPNVCFSTSGSKRFEILPFSPGLLTPSVFSIKSGVFSSLRAMWSFSLYVQALA
ncbi:F-box/FBD/LRR-repeat protein At1g13570 isoform X2 [Helianthus annuus]|uniref:F-box/FBD/LRR-repeat protein At1g13570 isoform X2 n=1 Tax=Helianthus annuus TaxID=4232 RepID=UPI0016534162|nr:F-box/FBD/LRR-repeat protein At1g13570 isoform X2 [Helianthus annuus]